MFNKTWVVLSSVSLLTACQAISPIFVDYHGVRRDVAQWINHKNLLSMQQKRDLVAIAQVEQTLNRIKRSSTIEERQTFAAEYHTAYVCHASQLNPKHVKALQLQIYEPSQLTDLHRFYENNLRQLEPKPSDIQCNQQ
jgi:hypothetical protein